MPGPSLNGLDEAQESVRETSLAARGKETSLHGGRNAGTLVACSNTGRRKLPNNHWESAKEFSVQNLKSPPALLLPLVIKCMRREMH